MTLWGANLTDELYHNLGVGMEKSEPDLGRYNVTKDEKDKGAFKTPTIRNVARELFISGGRREAHGIELRVIR